MANDDGLGEMVGQPERIRPFIEYLRAGLSEDWEFVEGKHGTSGKRDAPRRLGLPARCYCFRTKRADVIVADNDDDVDADDDAAGGAVL